MCSRTPLDELSKHYPVGFTLRPCSPTDKHFNASPALSSFRQLSSHPLSSTLATAPVPEPGSPTLPHGEWAAFRAPRSQMEALPPLSAASFPDHSQSSTFVSAFRPPSPCPWEVGTPSDDAPSSAYWNPEQETLHSLRTATSSWSSPSSFSPTSTRPKRPVYDFPSADEAASVASTSSTLRNGRLGAGEAEDSARTIAKGGEVKAGKRKAHALTLLPAADAGWDFERLFGKPRRWDGASEDGMLGAEESPARVEELGRTTWKDAHRGPREAAEDLCAELKSTEELQERAMSERGKEGQRETFETMRRVALERLTLLGAHLAWAGSGSGGGVGK